MIPVTSVSERRRFLSAGKILYVAVCPVTGSTTEESAWTGEDFPGLKREVDRQATAGTITRDVRWYSVFHSPKYDGGVLIVSRRTRGGSPLPPPTIREEEKVLTAIGILFERVSHPSCGEYLKPLALPATQEVGTSNELH